MKKSHKVWILILFSVVFGISSLINISYTSIAETAVTIMSITLAAYIAVASALLGSPFSSKLKNIPCPYNKTLSNLGSLAQYLRLAGRCSIFTLVISCINLCVKDKLSFIPFILKRLLIGFAFGVFSINFLFLVLIFEILTVSMMNAAVE